MKNESSGLLILLCIGMFIICLWSVSFGVSVGLSVLYSPEIQNPSYSHNYKTDYRSSAVIGAGENDGSASPTQNSAQEPTPQKGVDAITWFTGALVIIGGIQCFIYWRQKDIMELSRGSLELAERAELQIFNLSLPPANRFEATTKLEIAVKNFGRTVATDVISNVRFHDMESATAGTTPCIIPPEGTNIFPYLLTDIRGPLTPEEYKGFNSGTNPFRIVVEVSFTDIFDKRVTTVYEIFWDVKDRGFKFTAVRRKQ